MVRGKWAPFLVLVGVSLAICAQPVSGAELCFTTRIGMGQNLQTLYCGKDSCFMMLYATAIPRPASVRLYGIPVSRDTLSKGDSLVQSLLKRKSHPLSSHASTTFEVERNGVGISLPRHPGTESRISSLEDWLHNRKDELHAHSPLWKDSLILMKIEDRPGQVEVRLSSPPRPTGSLLGSVVSLRLIRTFDPAAVLNKMPTQADWPADSLAPLLSGGALRHTAQAGVSSIRFVLKVRTSNHAPPLPNSCMEGVFEYRSGTIGIR